MNGEVCCILGVYCPQESAEQREALVKELLTDKVVEAADAAKVAAWVLKHFDLAPPGSLKEFKHAIATMAKEKP